MTDQLAQVRAVAAQWMERVWRQRDVHALDALHAPNFVDHSPARRGTDNAAYKAGILALYAAFPDWSATTDDFGGRSDDGQGGDPLDRHRHARGTCMSAPPTGRLITFTGIEIVQIVDGRIMERWGEWNSVELLDQMGAFGVDA